jgi:hypothetical protein
VLAANVGGSDEGAWFARQVEGALAINRRVHVLALQGSTPRTVTNGAFTLHELAAPLDRRLEMRRDVALAALSAASATGAYPFSGEPWSGSLLDGGMVHPWHSADAVLADLEPDLVVIVDYRQVGALEAVNRVVPDVPVVLVPLVSELDEPLNEHYRPVFDRAGAVLVATESEAGAVRALGIASGLVHRVGVPLAVNPSIWSEPIADLAGADYLAVVTSESSYIPGRLSALARLVRLRYPRLTMATVTTDSFDIWHDGCLTRSWMVERRSDLIRLVAWSRALLDLRPGRLFARTCAESVACGTPVIVPRRSRAHEHAAAGGGLWYENPGDLTWCVGALADDGTREALSQAGRRYAEARFVSGNGFVEAVTNAVGLAP